MIAYTSDSVQSSIIQLIANEYNNDDTPQRSGVIVESASGGGKTWFLKALNLTQYNQQSIFYDCSTLIEAYPGDLVRQIFKIFESSRGKLLLLDNIDSLFTDNKNNKFNSATFIGSAFISAIDDLVIANGFLVATCSSSAYLPLGLNLTRRLGAPMIIPHPSAFERNSLFRTLLADERLRISIEKLSVDQVCNELSLRTQGYSVGDVVQLVRNCIHKSLIELGTADKTINIDPSDLLAEAYNIQPSAADFTGLLTRAPPAPTPIIGLEIQQNKLERAVLGSLNMTSTTTSAMRPCRGILIYGPSGTGKSSLASWVAYTAKDRFRQLVVPCADLVHKVVGESERRISECFQTARRMAPCLLLLDNLEIILGGGESGTGMNKRSNRASHPALDRVLSSLLVEIDGLGSTTYAPNKMKEGPAPVIVIATTTNINGLDKALIRPGRLEEHIELKYPSQEQRFQLLSNLLCQLDLTRFEGSVDIAYLADKIASITEGKSQADLVNLIQEATFKSLAQFLRNRDQKIDLEIAICSCIN